MPRLDPMPRARSIVTATTRFSHEVLSVYWSLLRLMVPTLIVVKLLDMVGGTQWLAWLLSPAMQLVGLPDAMGIVWASVLLTNLYTGLVVFFGLLSQVPLSVAEVTVLGTMMLVAHSLPVEAAVARAAGVSWRATLLIRVGGALVLGALLNLVYTATGTLSEPVSVLWQAPAPAVGLGGWALEQGETLLWILVILFALMAFLRLLRWLRVEQAMQRALGPVLRLIGIRKEAANITIIGVTLGITLGAGLLIREVRTGSISHRDVFLTMGFLGLCHSLIEDTLLILLMGADLSGILWARLLFALAVIGIAARLPALNRRLNAAPATSG